MNPQTFAGSFFRRAADVLDAAAGAWTGASFDQLKSWILRPDMRDPARVSNPYEQVSWVFAGVQPIINTMAGFPCTIFAGGSDQALTNGAAYELLDRPQPHETCSMMIERLVAYYVLTGEAHLIYQDMAGRPTSIGSEIKRLAVVGYNQMQPLRGANGELLAWRYTPIGGSRSVTILPDEVGTLKLFNPRDPIRGLSKLKAATLGIAQDYNSSLYNIAALRNGGSPGGIVSFPERSLTPEQRALRRREIEARHGGAENANRVMVLEGGATWQQVAMSNVDLSMIDLQKLGREGILAALGTPPVVAGLFDAAHYNVAPAAQAIFVRHTLMPIARQIQNLFNVVILPLVQQGARLQIDMSGHPALQEIEWSKIDTFNKMLSNGVPYNEASTFLGLKIKPQKWGDTSLLQSGLLPAKDVVEGTVFSVPELPVPNDDDDEDQDDDPAEQEERDEEAAALERYYANRSVQRDERRAIEEVTPSIRSRYAAHFRRQSVQMVRNLRRVAKQEKLGEQSSSYTWTKAANDAERIARKVLLDLGREQSRLRDLVRGYWTPTAQEAVLAELERFGIEGEQAKRIVSKLRGGRLWALILRRQQSKVANIELVTRARIVRTLRQGIDSGETVTQLAERIQHVMNSSRGRALNIARTEAGSAVTTGRFLGMESAGVDGKGWIPGANTRPTHDEAGRDYNPRSSPIPIDRAFSVGADKLMYPRDPRGSAAEVVNCNCTLVPVRLKRRKAAA